MTTRGLILGLSLALLSMAPVVLAGQEPAGGVSGFKIVRAPGATETDSNAVNNLGVIAGDYVDKAGVQHGMLLQGKTLTTVDRTNCTNTHGFTAIALYGVNNKGKAVGWCQDTVTGFDDAFSYLKGKFITISPPGSTSTQANGINDKGQIVGTYFDSSSVQHGFVLSGGKYTTLDVTGGDTGSVAWGINKNGLITLFAVNSSGAYDSFLFDGKSYTLINVPGEADSFVAGIDSSGDRIYTVLDSTNNIHGAFFLNVNGGTYTVFNDPKGLTNTQAFGINDKLKIVGTYLPSNHRKASNPTYQSYEAIGCCRGIPPHDFVQSH